MELNDHEKEFILYYKNFSKNIANPKKKSIDNLTKEKTWVNIYQKIPIEPSNNLLLFLKLDEVSIMSELDTLVSSMN